jgi:hypothetical protein
MKEVVPVQEEHILELAETMQKEDKNSIWALSHLSPEQGLRHSLRNAVQSNTWLVNGEVGAIYGISKPHLLSDSACAWMLGSGVIMHYPKYFMEGSRDWVHDAVDRYGILRNFVDARHKRSIRWLKWLGFTLHPAIPIGIERLPFHPNELRKS